MVMTVDEAEVLASADRLLSEYPPASTDPLVFLRAQYDAGLAWVEFPPGAGGLGAAAADQQVVDDRLRDAGASRNEPGPLSLVFVTTMMLNGVTLVSPNDP